MELYNLWVPRSEFLEIRPHMLSGEHSEGKKCLQSVPLSLPCWLVSGGYRPQFKTQLRVLTTHCSCFFTCSSPELLRPRLSLGRGSHRSTRFRGAAAPLGARPPVGGRARTSGRLARGVWETRSGVACDTPMCFLKGEDVELELWKMPHLSEKNTSNTHYKVVFCRLNAGLLCPFDGSNE